jgi:hypothetical protein
VLVVLVIVAGLLVWVGATLIIDGWLRRPRRPDLVERLRPFQPYVADEAEAKSAVILVSF